jgi:hypothetical protein
MVHLVSDGWIALLFCTRCTLFSHPNQFTDRYLIINFNNTTNAPDAFSRVVFGLAEAAKGIRASKQAQLAGPPTLIFVGSGSLADLVAQAIEQEQYGGAKAYLCATQEEALALAREKLPAS